MIILPSDTQMSSNILWVEIEQKSFGSYKHIFHAGQAPKWHPMLSL